MTPSLVDRTLAILDDLIAFPTISSDGNLELIAYANRMLDEIGVKTHLTLDPSGRKANLFATIGPDVDGGIVLSGHTDVVPVEGQDWSSDPFVARRRDGRVYGRGSCDMKGFIACSLALTPFFAERASSRPVHLALTYDEEVGCLGAGVMLEALKQSGRKPAACLIGEPTLMRIIEGHKGCCEYTTRFLGLEGHASQPGKGVNAIEHAVRYVGRLLEAAETLKTRAPEGSRYDPPWTTVQVGRIEGGIARNIIARDCTIEWEFRPVARADYDFLHDDICRFVDTDILPKMRAVFPDAGVRTEVIGEVAGLEPMPRCEAVEIARALTGSEEPAECVSFGTEAGLYQQLGISTVVCGPGSIAQAHKPDEFIEISQIEACIAALQNLGGRVWGS